ncbi:MAG: diacylglycerol kinase [Treponema sp.]|jgi:diacylglycerol kinase family enzyme|nr:diacylglycerol kinase [Treponema sp.]
MMDMEFFFQSLAEICSRSCVAPGRPLRWIVIANPTAGGFTIKARWKEHHRVLEAHRKKVQANPLREAVPSETAKDFGASPAASALVTTSGPGVASKITRAFIEEAGKNAGPFYLIITAGGDGTNLEVLSSMYQSPASFLANAAVLRLPMGTGNDGADSAELTGALDLLVKPVHIEFAPALRLLTAPGGPAQSKGPFLAFNILSAGLDAFVTHMTNKMKEKFPGDSYKLWVDIAALLYDRLYKVDFLDVRVLDEQQRELRSFREKVLLMAMGASGHRTYGSHQKILPDDRNVCILRQMPLLRKVALKKLFSTGTHIDKPESILFSAHRLEFSGVHPILAQTDGESVLLRKEDFPAAIELTPPVIPILKIIPHGALSAL